MPVASTDMLPIAVPPELRRLILRTFTTKYGLQLHSSSISFIASTLASHGLLEQPPEWNEAIEALANGIVENQTNTDASASSVDLVTAASLEKVYSALVVADSAVRPSASEAGPSRPTAGHHELTEGEIPDPDRYFSVVNAFTQPKLTFDQNRKVFERCSYDPTLLPSASTKSAFVRERLNILKSVIARNENFCPPLAISTASDSSKQDRDSFMKLTSTKNLLGRQGKRFLLFGMLSTASDGRYELEDLDGVVGLDMEDAIPGEGIFTEGSLILVEGEYTEEERIRVFALGHPPSETRQDARQIHAHADVLGTGAITVKDEKAYRMHEEQHDDLCFVFISDLHLDHPKTMSSFRAMMQGYTDADFVPYAFVLCGNFSSTPWTGAEMVTKYQSKSNRARRRDRVVTHATSVQLPFRHLPICCRPFQM